MRRHSTITISEKSLEVLISLPELIIMSKNSDQFRMNTLNRLKMVTPFFAGAFFEASPQMQRLEGSVLLQPIGSKVLHNEFEQHIRSCWSFDGKDSGTRNRFFRGSIPPSQALDLASLCGHHMLTCWFVNTTGPTGALSLCRKPSESAFSEADQKMIELIYPYINEKLQQIREENSLLHSQMGTLADIFALTKRELEVAECIAYGMEPEEISRKLNISKRTVHKHLEHIYRKTGTNSSLSLMKVAHIYKA